MGKSRAAIPLIDFGPFLGGEPRAMAGVAREMAEACETIGFFYLANHGLAGEKIESIFAASHRFHALPIDEKMAQELRLTPDGHSGFVPLASRQWENTGAPDLNDKIEFVLDLPADDPDILAGNRWFVRNKWPKSLPAGWRSTVLDYLEEMIGLMRHLHRCFALALGLPEEFFAGYYRKPMAQMSLLHYPSQDSVDLRQQYGIHPHTDGTTVTILAQDNTGGLQVLAKDRSWIDITPIPDTFVVNLGHMMARWTNDRFAATPHRVINRTGRERYSIPFFARPDFDAIVSPLPGCIEPGALAKYEPLEVGPSLLKKQKGDFVKGAALGDDAIRV